jgi:hypothetical protein
VRRTCVPLWIIALTLLVPAGARACQCLPKPPPGQALNRADAVFAGKAVRVYPSSASGGRMPGNQVDFRVEKSWKGTAARSVSLWTDSAAMCGYAFTPGVYYLVYAYGEQTHLYTNICTRTAPLRAAGQDLAALEEPRLIEAIERRERARGLALSGAVVAVGLLLLAFAFLRGARRRTVTEGGSDG